MRGGFPAQSRWLSLIRSRAVRGRGGSTALQSFVFAYQSLEPPGQNLAHHGVVVAGLSRLVLDVEFPIVRLGEALRARDDHGADGAGPHDVAVVEHLDTAWHAWKPETLGDTFQQTALRRAFGEPASQRLAGVVECMLDEIRLGAALGQADFDVALCLQRQRLLEQRARGELVREQDEARHGLVVVELGDEALQHLLEPERAVGLGKVGAVAPVLPAPEEEHLDAGLAAFLMGREDVGLLDAVAVDRLIGRYVRECLQPVAKARGALELEPVGGLQHHPLQLGTHGLALAAQEFDGLVNEHGVVGLADLASARRRAALDLVQQTRPGAAVEHTIGAGAQQKRTLQRVDRAVDGAGRGERPEEVALAAAGATMLQDLRRLVIAPDENEGERLVVAHQHVEARPEALDQIGFEQQRLGLGADRDELHRRRRQDHARDAIRMAANTSIVRDAGLQIARLADVDHRAVGIDHAIHARCRGEVSQIAGNHVRTGTHRCRDRCAGRGNRCVLRRFSVLSRHVLVLGTRWRKVKRRRGDDSQPLLAMPNPRPRFSHGRLAQIGDSSHHQSSDYFRGAIR